MKSIRGRAWLTACAMAFTTAAFAQAPSGPVTPVVPVSTVTGYFGYSGESPLAEARRLASKNDIPSLKTHFKKLITEFCKGSAFSPDICNLKRNTYRVSFVGQLPATAVGLVFAIVDGVEDKPIRFHGISGSSHPLIDVFLTDDPASKETKYSSTTDSDPLATNALLFAQAVLGKIQLPTSTGVFVGHGLRSLIATVSSVSTLTVSATTLYLPQSRATIRFDDALALPASQARMARWAEELFQSIKVQLPVDDASLNCFSTLNDALRASVAYDCEVDKASACGESLKAALDKIVYHAPAPCDGDAGRQMGLKYAALAAVFAGTPVSTTSVANIPAVHLTFGVATGRLSQPSLANGFARAKVGNDQKYVSDPLNRVVTIGTINWMSARRPEDAWYRGMVGAFAGVAMAPNFGPAGGFTVMLPKVPIGLVFGWTQLWVDQIETTKLGTSTPDINTAIPLRSGWASASFFGASYVFNAAK